MSRTSREKEFLSNDAHTLDAFGRVSREEQARLRTVLGQFFLARDGLPELAAERLPERDAFFAGLPPLAGNAAAAWSPRDPRAALVAALGKANQGEAYGVDYELAALQRNGEPADGLFLHVALQERYHTRLLAAACEACGGALDRTPPPPGMRFLIRSMSWLPDSLRFLLILCGEVVGAGVFDLLHEARRAFRADAAVEARVGTLLAQIHHDELAHVAYCRTRVPRWLLPLGRVLQPFVTRAVLAGIPEFAELGGGTRAARARLNRPLRLPAGMGWLADGAAAPLPPGPRVPARTALRLVRDPLRLFTDLAREHGDVVRIGVQDFYLLSHPADVEHVFKDPARRYRKARKTHQRAEAIFGEGLILAEGDAWQTRRRGLVPAFGKREVERWMDPILAEVEALRNRLEIHAAAGIPIDVKAATRTLAQDVFTSAFLGARDALGAERTGDAMAELGRYVDAAVRRPVFLPPAIPTPRNLRMRAAMREIDAALERLAAARGRGASGDDLFSRLLALHGNEPEGRRALRDDLVNFFVAGHETSANTLAWSLHLLSRHPAARRRLCEEVRDVCGRERLRSADLPRLAYTEAVVKETLRLYPPAWMIAREPVEDDCIRGYRIPRGATVLLSPWITQRRADFWPAPGAFDPERFLSDEPRTPFAWYPFGGGPRSCIGQRFAMVELTTILATLHQRVELEAQDAAEVAPLPRMTLEPAPFRLVARLIADPARPGSSASRGSLPRAGRSGPAAHSRAQP